MAVETVLHFFQDASFGVHLYDLILQRVLMTSAGLVFVFGLNSKRQDQ